MRMPIRSLLMLACALLMAHLTGCSTYADRLQEIRSGYASGDLIFARTSVEEGLAKKGNDVEVLKLERAMLELAEGKPHEAQRTLREVRDQFDALEGSDIGESTLAMLTDDNAYAYAGEDYEKVLIRAMLTLSNLMTDGQDALAYSLQTIDKQQQIIHDGTDANGKNPKLAYKRIALGPYVHGLLREATHSNFDDSQRATAMVCSWQPDFKYGAFDLQRAQMGRHSAPGNGVLYVFGLVGAGPYKIETIELPTQVAMLIADRILSNNLNQSLPPTLAPIPVPKVIKVASNVTNIRVAVNGQPVGTTETVTDIGEIAVQQYNEVFDQIVARAVVRRTIKKGIVYGAKESVGIERDTLSSFAFDALGVVWEATESADTRCWGLLPDKIQVLRIELPAGEHAIELQAIGNGVGGRPVVKNVTINNGYNSYIMINCPGLKPVGQVLVSQP
ncbi:MAG: hypothetical protein SGJ20_20200 [Planctomycetota bacterium]|nr:hypothetical protein [Planctomycetota bacterium]